MDLSVKFGVPVILRPTIRVCHGRQNIVPGELKANPDKAVFEKNPARWAATPRFRFMLHGELNRKLKEIGETFNTIAPYNAHDLQPGKSYPLGIIAGGVSWAVVKDLLAENERRDIPLLKLGAPYPFPERLADEFMAACDTVLVVEETDTVIELFLRDKVKVRGRLSGHVPSEGELVPQVVEKALNTVLDENGLELLKSHGDPAALELVQSLELPIRKPTLCAGCPHRAAFFAIRKARPKAIYTSDIGCYTLGMNLGGVDTCLDMGAGITLGSGFYQAFKQDEADQPVVATMGDSTFFHSGMPGLLNAVYNDARFILVILDNQTTAMTGMQPAISTGIRADGSQGNAVTLEQAVAGCGVEFIEVVDPYDLNIMRSQLKKAAAYAGDPDGGIAAIIARHPCVINDRQGAVPKPTSVTINDNCDLCGFCHDRFECPALYKDLAAEQTRVDPMLCADCGVCLQVCPKDAIEEI